MSCRLIIYVIAIWQTLKGHLLRQLELRITLETTHNTLATTLQNVTKPQNIIATVLITPEHCIVEFCMVMHPCTLLYKNVKMFYCRWTTKIHLPLRSESYQTKNLFHDVHPSLLLFLHRLRSITIINEVINAPFHGPLIHVHQNDNKSHFFVFIRWRSVQ